MINIALVGKTGSGKSTLAKSLSRKYDLHIIDSDILREYIKGRHNGWEVVENCLSVGAHVPDELLEKCLDLRIKAVESRNGYVLDNLFSVGLLYAFEKFHKLDFVFHIDVSDELAESRV